MNQTSNNSKLISLLQISLFAAILSVCSLISIPLTVPITMQTFFIFLICLLIGGKKGTCVILLWILLGIVGLPVFSGFKSAASAILGPTGGYIVGFIFIGITMWIFEYISKNNIFIQILSMLFGLTICYIMGTIWFVIVNTFSNNYISIISAIQLCILPFVIFDVIKMILALVISRNKIIKNIFGKC